MKDAKAHGSCSLVALSGKSKAFGVSSIAESSPIAMATSVGASCSAIIQRTVSKSLKRPRFASSNLIHILPIRASISTSSNTTTDFSAPLLDSFAHRKAPKTKGETQISRKCSPTDLPDLQDPQLNTTPTQTSPRVATPQTLDLPPKRIPPTKPVNKAIDSQHDPSIQTLLPLLLAQPPYYISLHIHNKPFLVTLGDKLRLPFRIPSLCPGDVLRLNRASLLGSRDYTLKAGSTSKGEKRKWIDERLFLCRAVVLGEEMEPERVKEKKQQRNRRIKRIRSQHVYTVLRISELKVFGPEALLGDGKEGSSADETGQKMEVVRNAEVVEE